MNLAKGVAESLKNPVARSMLEFFTGSIWQVGFAKSLSLLDAAEVTSVSPQGMEIVYRVPANLCIQAGTVMGANDHGSRSETMEAFLPCGVTTALFDEVSTLAMLMNDRTCRPGVSISLSCHVFRPVRPGEMVTFRSRGLKMGARIGYGESSMYREDGKLAARGRHIKYLPMGVIWDMVATPFLFPLAREAQCRVHDRWLADPERTKGIPSSEHVMDMFQLEDLEQYESAEHEHLIQTTTATDSVTMQHNSTATHSRDSADEVVGGAAVAGRGVRSAEAEMLVTRRQCNYMPGTFHGGAIAVAAEEIGRRCPPVSLVPDLSRGSVDDRVQYMEVHYMSAIKRRAGLAAVSTSTEGAGREVTRVGLSEAGGAGGGALCAEAVLLWGGGNSSK